MLVSVANRYHRKLEHPLQLLAGFFSVYSKVDFAKVAVTVEGCVSVSGENGGSLGKVLEPVSDLLIPAEMLLRYQQRYGQSRINTFGRAHSTQASVDHVVAPGVPIMAMRSVGSVDRDEPRGDARQQQQATHVAAAASKYDAGIRAASYTVSHLNIVNPLDLGENLIHVKVSSRRANRFAQVLQAGAKNLQPVLSHLEKELERTSAGNGATAGSFSTSVALFDNFFSNSWSRFGQGWRPDVDPSTGGANSPTMEREEREMRGSIERESEEVR